MDVARVATWSRSSCLVLMILLAGCSGDRDDPRPAAEEPTASPSARSYSSDEADDIDTARSSAEQDTCRRATVRARQAMAWPLVQVVDLVAGDVDGRSAEAATMVRRSLEKVVRRTDIAGVCGGLPRPTAALQSVALKAASEPVGIHRLARLERAFTTWSEATGGKSTMRGAVDEVRHCRAVDDYFRVGYELWWDHAPYGRRWWMVLVLDNDTERSPLVTLAGSLKATHVVDPSSWGRVGNAHLFRWGGSSADYAEAPPGHSTNLVGVSGRPEVRTTEEGRLFDIRSQVYLRSGRVNCSLPVPRLN